MEKLTPSQEKALGYIHQSIEERGSAPTLRELCAHMGYKAIGSAQDVVAALRKKGFLVSPTKQAARAFALTDKARQVVGAAAAAAIDDLENYFMVPCLGSVPAGNPIEAIEERVDTMRISKNMIPREQRKSQGLFALRASGESMVGAGIMDGDWLVVNSQKEAESGSIIVARIDGDATCKRLVREENQGWYLKPENPAFSPIYANESPFEIVGKVVALQRSVM